MDTLFNPNIAYMLLVLGVFAGLIGLLTPGTGLFESAAFLALGAAAYLGYHVGVNLWAAILIILAVFPFLLALAKKEWRLGLLALTAALTALGSSLLFRGEAGNPFGVNPLLALVVSVLFGGLLWLLTERTLAAMQKPQANDPNSLVGQVGEARSRVKEDGTVQAGGELWSARSKEAIAEGTPVRILARDGFILIVEAIQE
jgi:membrane-bound serine protease (ClpP class)